MVRSYLRHGGTEVFGLIASNSGNSLFDGRRAFVPALEDVYVWDVKRGELVGMWHATGHYLPVTFISRSPVDADKFAIGYQDGSIRIWSAQNKSEISKFQGHRRAISYLEWEKDGSRLASGALDGEIILWDVSAEAGLFKLRGHNNRITCLSFVGTPTAIVDPSSSNAILPSNSHLLSTSQDTYLKLWDLQTQYSVESVIAHRSESWSVTIIPQRFVSRTGSSDEEENSDLLLLTTGGEGEAKLWTLSVDTLLHGPQYQEDGQGLKRAFTFISSLTLNTSGAHGQRVSGAIAHPYSLRGGISGVAIAFQVGDRSVEVWRIRSIEEIKKKRARRNKRELSKRSKSDETSATEASDQKITWGDRLCPWITLRGSAKLASFAFPPTSNPILSPDTEKPAELQILLALTSNSLELLSIPRPTTTAKMGALRASIISTLGIPGHRTNIRTVAISHDDQLVASGSNGALKVWNVKTQKCIRTMECGYALCAKWLPGDRHILVGTKTGQLMLYELSSSTLLESRDSHTGPIHSIDIKPDGKGFVTGGADKCVKFWSFVAKAIESLPDSDSRPESDMDRSRPLTLSISHQKTMKMTDSVLGTKYSPDSKFLAVSSLDCTVKVFFQDTLKFFLSMYGHKLPVLGMDISFDSKLLITCSADKNIKIWGLDFGDCHKSIFAHDESISQVAFEADSHYFWSVGSDGLVKYWDGDKFENIQTLEGHHQAVSSLDVSHSGQFLITCSVDKSIRVWEKTDEPLFLEEEREKELEKLYEKEETEQADFRAMRQKQIKEADGPAEESCTVSKPTAETLMSGERIIEALILAAEDLESSKQYRIAKKLINDDKAAEKLAPPARNPIFHALDNISAHAYVLKIIQNVPRPALEDALLVLPFAQVTMLFEHIEFWVEKELMLSLVCRVLFFLLRTHESQITSTGSLKLRISSIKTLLEGKLKRQKEMIAYNSEAIRLLKKSIESDQLERKFVDINLASEEEVIAKSKKRRLVM
ncbi:hypothetical protein PPACK8108_LOCUS866 [Phakopsora pachyrhizi]|uniref:Small-subunit processome Utp12 domain-containing protein n=1 Tax=Phakopsora pachyrhizi TaxID=170000 RepID=A0AAV0AFT7_PHAPC|nr:hypothetical protein PPACK8108_LOCUS866 [Phakopsora pachyrhizi]